MYSSKEVDEMTLLPSLLRKETREAITAHRFAIMILIRQYRLYCVGNGPYNLFPRQRMDFCIMILKLIQSPDMTYAELTDILNSGRYTLEKKFIHRFQMTMRHLYHVGVNYLLDLVEYISNLVANPQVTTIFCHINKNSVLGNIKHKVVYECLPWLSNLVGICYVEKNDDCLQQFEWLKTRLNNQVERTYLRRQTINFHKLSYSEVVLLYEAFKVYYDPRKHFLNSTEKDFENEISESLKNTKLDATVWPAEPNQWSRRQAEFFIATQSANLLNDEAKAMPPQDLHQQIKRLLTSHPDLAEAHFLSYLNYMRIKDYCGALDGLYHCFDKQSEDGDGKSVSDETSKTFRYAALNLATIHAQFGHEEEALAALKECIIKAQEANDDVCLQHALSWLYKLSPNSRRVLMEHAVVKSCDLNMKYLMSLGLQSYTQLSAVSAGSPKQIFQTMSLSDVSNYQHSYLDLIVNNYAQSSALWLLYGKTDLSSLWTQQLLHLNGDSLSPGGAANTEGVCQAFCSVADGLLMQGEYVLSRAVLSRAKEMFPNEPLANSWKLSELLYKFLKSFHNGCWRDAETAAVKMAQYDRCESWLRCGELHLAKNELEEARQAANFVLALCKAENVSRLRTFHVARALIIVAASLPADKKLPVLEKAWNFADQYHLSYLAAMALLHLAHLKLLLGMPCQALDIMDRCMVPILANGGAYDQARAWSVLVKCRVQEASSAPEKERIRVFGACAALLNKPKELYKQVEAYSRIKDAISMQALFYNEAGMVQQRNDAALEYRMFVNEYPLEDIDASGLAV